MTNGERPVDYGRDPVDSILHLSRNGVEVFVCDLVVG